MSRPPICWVCHRTDFQSWQEVYDHMEARSKDKNDLHRKNRSAQTWMKKFKHRNAINKLKKIGKKEQEPRQALTPTQLEAKHDTKYEPCGQKELVKVICPNKKCNNKRKIRDEFLEIEHTRNPEALKIGNCFVKFCGGCK